MKTRRRSASLLVASLLAPAALLMAGCASQPQQNAPANWGYQPGQQAPSVISEAEAETLTSQVAEMKAKRKEIRDGMYAVTDPNVLRQRQGIIDAINQQLQPLEYRLRAAGRPVPKD